MWLLLTDICVFSRWEKGCLLGSQVENYYDTLDLNLHALFSLQIFIDFGEKQGEQLGGYYYHSLSSR